MKHTRQLACLSCALLRRVRDARPSKAALLEWLGEDSSTYYVLRKAGPLSITDEVIELTTQYLSADGATFTFANTVYLLEADSVLNLR
ncbi:MAG: hypothetical protein ACHREM_11390 [Polyangiales bacterium]